MKRFENACVVNGFSAAVFFLTDFSANVSHRDSKANVLVRYVYYTRIFLSTLQHATIRAVDISSSVAKSNVSVRSTVQLAMKIFFAANRASNVFFGGGSRSEHQVFLGGQPPASRYGRQGSSGTTLCLSL